MVSKLFIVSGPSGVGKTHLAQIACDQLPTMRELKLFTTRPPRSKVQSDRDRICISEEEFNSRKAAHEFLVTGTFHGHQYGYPAEDLSATNECFIANTWPALLPKFTKLKNVILIGLTVNPDNMPLLQRRMLNRGDSHETVSERMKLVEKDMADIIRYRSQIQVHGKIFIIKDDTDLEDHVIPWMKSQIESPA